MDIDITNAAISLQRLNLKVDREVFVRAELPSAIAAALTIFLSC